MFGKIGEAFISIFADASDFQRDAEKQGQSVGQKMGTVVSGALGKAMKVGAGAGVAAFGAVAAKGFQRLNALDQAKAKMRGLFDDATASAMGFTDQADLVENVMGSALASVKGTAFGLGDAAKAAANALNSGIEPGEQLDRTLKAIVGSAAASGTSMEDLSYIFNKAATTGRADNEILLMLAERGIPIYKQLAKDMGVSEEAVRELARTGKVSFDQLVDSAGEASKNVAAEMGTTLQGRLSNAWAAVGRIGANLFEGVFDSLGTAVGMATEWLSSLEPAALSAGEWIGSFVERTVEAVKGLADAMKDSGALEVASQFFSVLRGDNNDAADGVAWAKPFMDVANVLREAGEVASQFFSILRGDNNDAAEGVAWAEPYMDTAWKLNLMWGELERGLGAFKQAWIDNNDEVTSSGFSGLMEETANSLRGVYDGFKSIVDSVGPNVGPLLLAISEAFAEITAAVGFSTWDLLLVALDLVAVALEALAPVLESVTGWLVDNEWAVKGLVGAYMAWSLQSKAIAFGGILAGLAKSTIAWAKDTIATAANTGAKIASKAESLALMAMYAKDAIVKGVSTAATWAQTAATKALNLALKANPIGLIITAITLLVGAFVVLYNKNEAFRELVQKVWASIKSAIGSVVSWMTDTAWPAIQGAWDAIAAGATWLWENALKPAWDGIKTAISAVVDWITGTAWPWIKGVFDQIGAAAEWLYVNFIRPQWILIGLAIEAFVNWFKDTAWPFIKKVFDWIGDAAKWLYEKAIKPAWEGIKKGISAVVDWMKNTAWPAIKQVWDWIADAAKWLWEKGIKPAWDGIKGAVEAVVNWLRNTAWPWIKDVWDWIVEGAKWLWEGIKTAWDNIKAGIDVVVKWLRDTAWPLIKAAWDWIADGAKKMWEDWIKPAFDNFKKGIDVVVEAVDKAKTAISNTWSKITAAITGPLDAAKTFINNKFISPLNKMFEALKMTLRIPLISVGSSTSAARTGGPMLAMASGGTVPGSSPHPRADNIPIWATAGEYILPVNSTKRLMSQVGEKGMEMLRRGIIPGYALGGLVGKGVAWVKERGTDIIDLASKAWDVISDPAGALRDFANQALAKIGESPFAQAMASGARQIIGTLVAKIKEWVSAGGGGTQGGNNMGWQAMKAWFEATFPGQRITSGYRPGAVSVTGIVSDHALGRAIDMPPSMAIFNKIDSTWGNIRQLLYSPAGPRQIRGGRRSDTIGSPLRAQHWDHVHWAMADGGWVSPFKPFVADSGVLLAPGINVLDNRTGKPEPLARADEPRETPGVTLIVNNPVSEPTEVTLNRQMQRLAALGVVG